MFSSLWSQFPELSFPFLLPSLVLKPICNNAVLGNEPECLSIQFYQGILPLQNPSAWRSLARFPWPSRDVCVCPEGSWPFPHAIGELTESYQCLQAPLTHHLAGQACRAACDGSGKKDSSQQDSRLKYSQPELSIAPEEAGRPEFSLSKDPADPQYETYEGNPMR